MAQPLTLDQLDSASTLSADAAVPVVQSSDTFRTTPRAFITEAESFLQSGTGAVARTVQEKLREFVSVKDFKNTDETQVAGDGIQDDTSGIQRAIDSQTTGGIVFFPPGIYLIGAQLTVADEDKLTLLGCGRYSRIKKGFNGAMLSLGAESSMHGLFLDGDGVTYTGRGIIISTGANDNVSWRRITECDIIDTESYCVEFTQTIAGFKSVLLNCRFVPTLVGTTAIKMPGADEANGNRKIVGCDSASNPLVDLGGSENTHVIGCDGGIPLFDDLTTKSLCTGNRFVNDTFTYDGTNGAFTNNVIAATTWTFNSTLVASVFKGNSIATNPTITDNAPGATEGNDLEIPVRSFTPTWTASGSNPAIGDGQIGGTFVRRGTYCKGDIRIIMGSTTTFGTGEYSFSVPYTVNRTVVGSWYALDSGTAYYGGPARCVSGTNTVTLVTSGGGTLVSPTAPFTWAQNDQLFIDFDFPIT